MGLFLCPRPSHFSRIRVRQRLEPSVQSWYWKSMSAEVNWNSRLSWRWKILLPMFLRPTGTPLFLNLCSGFNGSKLIFFSLARSRDSWIALPIISSSSIASTGFYIRCAFTETAASMLLFLLFSSKISSRIFVSSPLTLFQARVMMLLSNPKLRYSLIASSKVFWTIPNQILNILQICKSISMKTCFKICQNRIKGVAI